MSSKSTIIKNWPKYLLQWGVLIALIVFMTGIVPSDSASDPEKYCPLGGLQALVTYLVNSSLPCSMSSVQVMMGIVMVAAVVLLSKLFCAFICPVATVQDLMGKFRRTLHIKGIKIRNGSTTDKFLRLFKYVLVFWIFYMTVGASELFCKNLDPYYAVATGFKGEITLWMSIVTITLTVLGGFLVDMFWCRYICPLGAISNSFKFWLWILVLFGVYFIADRVGADIPWPVLLGGFCITGYLLEILHAKPKLQILKIRKNGALCNGCGVCEKKCPYHINIRSFHDCKVNSVDCTLCGECVAACYTGALQTGISSRAKGRAWNFVPAVLSVCLIVFGIWAGEKIEFPTINMQWGIRQEAEDGAGDTLADFSSLETVTVGGLRSVKCYGSAMAFKARLEKIPGTHGVKVFVNKHSADILYDPQVTSPDKIRETIYVPAKFRVQSIDPSASDSLKVVTIRTEGMYDKMDISYLGLQMRQTGKKIYGLETEFACPLIVRVFMDHEEEASEDLFREIVEMDKLIMPVHGGDTKEIAVNFKFVRMEDMVSYIGTEDFIRNMFTPFKAEFKKRVDENAGKPQFIYEIADKNYEKPVIMRGMPFLSNHLSRNEGVIGVYLELNKDLVPAIMVRYAAPMTAEKIRELMNMETWSITYSPDDIRDVPAKMSFKTPGTEYPAGK